MSGLEDRAAPVRDGDALPVDRLAAYLRRLDPALDGPLVVRQFPAGFSNLTFLLSVGDTELVLRRPPGGRKPKSGHDMQREHTVLSALHGAFPYAPRPIAYCDDPSVVGAPFLVMERIRGVVVRRQLPPELGLDQAGFRTLCERLLDVQAELHRLDWRNLGLGEFGRPEGYAERQVRGWSDRYRRARTDDVPDFEEVMAWLAAELPAESGRAAIVHNDFKLDNVVLDPDDPTCIVGVLDWEMATIGDPLMDLGASLGYWVEAGDPPALRATRMMPTDAPGAPTRAELVERYAEATGVDVGRFDFYYVFGLFRLAAIAQQIYWRYRHGQASDPRFAALRDAVGGLDGAARARIDPSAH